MSPVLKICHALLLNAVMCLFFANVIDSASLDPAIPCTNDSECISYSHALKSATCQNGYCMCKNGTETKICSSIAFRSPEVRNAARLHHPCKQATDCSFPGGTCNTTNNQCTCQTNFVVSSDKQSCLEKAMGMGMPCTDINQCAEGLPNATCKMNVCACIDGYFYTGNDHCYRKVGFKENCTKSQECAHIDGAACLESKVCGCPAETVINMDKKRCLPAAREILQECTENVQCSITFPNASCIDKKCKCNEGYHYESEMTRCFVNKGLDEDCGNHYECFQVDNENVTGKALQCSSNMCTCAENYYREGNQCLNAAPKLIESTFWISMIFILLRNRLFC